MKYQRKPLQISSKMDNQSEKTQQTSLNVHLWHYFFLFALVGYYFCFFSDSIPSNFSQCDRIPPMMETRTKRKATRNERRRYKKYKYIFYCCPLTLIFIPFRLYLANPNGFDATKVRLIDQTLLSIFYILFFVLVFPSGVDKKRTSH